MKQQYHQLLTPEIINSISGLSLISKVIVDGFSLGTRMSNSIGAGFEFSQYKNYESGDDLRLLDWKMLARSGKYYIKQSEIDSNITVRFILDASNSMAHQENTVSKMDITRVLIASLAYISQKQGDTLGLFAWNEKKIYDLFPSSNNQQFNRLLQQLITIEPQGSWPKESMGFTQKYHRNQKELIVFFTDFYQQDSELIEFVKKLKTSKNEVLVLHMMTNKELTFDYKGMITFEDLETGSRKKVDAKIAKNDYLNQLELSIKQIKESLFTSQIDYYLFDVSQHIGEVLQLFLKKRTKII